MVKLWFDFFSFDIFSLIKKCSYYFRHSQDLVADAVFAILLFTGAVPQAVYADELKEAAPFNPNFRDQIEDAGNALGAGAVSCCYHRCMTVVVFDDVLQVGTQLLSSECF